MKKFTNEELKINHNLRIKNEVYRYLDEDRYLYDFYVFCEELYLNLEAEDLLKTCKYKMTRKLNSFLEFTISKNNEEFRAIKSMFLNEIISDLEGA